MGKGRKVPSLPRRAPEVEGQTALAEPSPGREQTEVSPEERSDQQPASFQGPASLPQRVRGEGERLRPPARVARPVLPESFLERVRAAAEAARREEGQASSDSPAALVPATTGSAFIAPPREPPAAESPGPGPQAQVAEAPVPEAPVAEAPVAEAPAPDAAPPVPSASLPRRVRGMSDGPRPPARVARPALSQALLERVRAAVQADADAEAEDHPQEPAPISLAGRGPAETGGPQSHAAVAPPAVSPGTSTPGDANTEPIPVISVTAEPAPPAQHAVADQPEAVAAPPERKLAEAPAKVKAAEAEAAKPEAAGQAKLRAAPSTHRTTPRVPRTGPGPGRPAQRQARTSRSYRVAGVLVATAAAGALVLGFAVFHHSGKGNVRGSNAGPRSAPTASDPTASAPTAGPAVIRSDAVAWVRTQLAPGTHISCDPAMCQALMSRGVAAGDLYALKPGMTNPLDSAVIVATPLLQSQIGSKLTSVYAPGLLARFGSGKQQIQVRAIAPHGVPGYMSEVKSDLAARRMSGAELAGSPGIVSSATARKELAAGEVDSRLMTVITGLAVGHPVDIVAFGESGPDTTVAPFRSAELAENNMQAMRRAVSIQPPPYRAAHMTSVRLSSGRVVLRIEFTAPSPFGLLGGTG
jgi:hypothetical protein